MRKPSHKLFSTLPWRENVIEAELVDRDGIVIEQYPKSDSERLGPRVANFIHALTQALANVDCIGMDTVLVTNAECTLAIRSSGAVYLAAIMQPDSNLGALLAFADSVEDKLEGIGSVAAES